MSIIDKEVKMCFSCMEEHEVEIVTIPEKTIFKGDEIEYVATYEHCTNTDEYFASEEFLRQNTLAMKDAYRVKAGLLTSTEILGIRKKYGISQKDFSEVLDWGMATITRYENYQVQDRAHDDILRKIDTDPKWFMEMLERSKARLSDKAYQEYSHNAICEYKRRQKQYLVDSIMAEYAGCDDNLTSGGASLDLQKVVEMINYIAQKVVSLHKVKLMKMLWYSDSLHFKRYGTSISGLVYVKMQMGAVPIGRDQIIYLDGVCFDEVEYDEYIGYKFRPTPNFSISKLSVNEIAVMDVVIEKLGGLYTREIVEKMHEESAFSESDWNGIIDFKHSISLSLD